MYTHAKIVVQVIFQVVDIVGADQAAGQSSHEEGHEGAEVPFPAAHVDSGAFWLMKQVAVMTNHLQAGFLQSSMDMIICRPHGRLIPAHDRPVHILFKRQHEHGHLSPTWRAHACIHMIGRIHILSQIAV